MRRLCLIVAAAFALTLSASAAASTGGPRQSMVWGDEGGGGTWYGLPCNAYYYGWVVTINGQTAVCVSNGVYWEWYPV